MDTRVRTALQTMRTPPKQINHHRVKQKKEILQSNKLMDEVKNIGSLPSRRERKMALQQDVDKLKKKLRHEENVHRALERAFTRPLGALPRLPPYLPPYTLELLAEVAVLEEEVVRLEEQVVNFRHGLYQEAIYISSSKKAVENAPDLYPSPNVKKASGNDQSSPSRVCSDPNQIANTRTPSKKTNSSSTSAEARRGKENHSDAISKKTEKQSPQRKLAKIRTSVSTEKHLNTQTECKETNREKTIDCSQNMNGETVIDADISPNKISEDILKCLLSVFSRMGSPETCRTEGDMDPSTSGFYVSLEDPYGIHPEFGKRDVGPYKHFRSIEPNSIDPNLISSSSYLTCKIKSVLKKLESVDLRGLSHQQKLAFWINIYNSCMMNAILEQGIPSSPEMVVALMQKAMINVGGRLLSAMTIEHFILRLPYNSKCAFSMNAKNNDMTARSILGLDWPEPLVTFALSCGSWSSPAVRVYTASQVENELETAKREYLQAAVGISLANKFAIPKLLDWYLLDFAKDVESLMDWICLQLPSGLRNDAVRCIERARRGASPSQSIQVLAYEFSFRYLLPR